MGLGCFPPVEKLYQMIDLGFPDVPKFCSFAICELFNALLETNPFCCMYSNKFHQMSNPSLVQQLPMHSHLQQTGRERPLAVDPLPPHGRIPMGPKAHFVVSESSVHHVARVVQAISLRCFSRCAVTPGAEPSTSAFGALNAKLTAQLDLSILQRGQKALFLPV